MTARGRFITLEGGEGTGKSTQARLLAERLRASGHEVVATREPGGTPGAESVRALLVEGDPGRWDGLAEALLVNAARADHAARLIAPALARGAWVVCDRYVHSTLAYQGAGKGIAAGLLRDLHRIATGDLWPDQVLLLDLPGAVGLSRAATRGGGRFEAHDTAFHTRVNAAFAAMAGEPTVARIDAEGTPEQVSARIWSVVTAPPC